jgi:hypothetical protein
MQLGDFAFGQSDDSHTGKAQMLEQRGHIGLVAGDAIQRLGQDDVEPAALGILQQGLDAGPKNDAGAGDGRVLIGFDDLPSLPTRMLATDSELVLDRRDPLVIGGIAGVNHGLQHGVFSGSVLASNPWSRPPAKVSAFSGARLDYFLGRSAPGTLP